MAAFDLDKTGRIDEDQGVVFVTTTHLLWSHVPDHLKATETQIRKRYQQDEKYGGGVTPGGESLIQRLRSGGWCRVATSIPELGGKYVPCPMPVNDDPDRLCTRHGGRRKQPPSQSPSLRIPVTEYHALLAELDALRSVEKEEITNG